MTIARTGKRRLHELQPTRDAVKAVTPAVASVMHAMRLSAALDLSGVYISMLNGKGSGSGWDGGETLAAARLLQRSKAPVVLDCGANLGSWTNGVRARLGHSLGRWILVEPMTEYAQALAALTNVQVIAAAVGEAPATMQLHVPDRPSGWMSLHRRRDSFAHDVAFSTREVPVLRIDDIVRDAGIEHIDFVKMDLEGHEFFAMRGALDCLQQGRIAALSFEFGSANVNSRVFFRDMWDLLEPLGYQISRIVPGGRVVAVTQYDETLEFFRGATNYLATLRDSRICGD
jgi:FkbM family methyltransferase